MGSEMCIRDSDELVARFDGHIDESELVKEDVTFALPVQLRILKHEMSQ